MGRLIGYARVSTSEQDLGLQRRLCGAWGVAMTRFSSYASGARTSRLGLEACLQILAPGDTLVVWRLIA